MTTQRATCWSITINNPTPQDEEYIALARQRGWTIDGQREKGAQGTEHYQLLARTPQVRFSQVKKAFPRAHIEVARNVPALAAYVHKSDTRVSELPESSERFPSLSKLWELIYDELDVGWNSDECSVRLGREPLSTFDRICSQLIRKGYHVETMAVNPQIRSCFAKFALDLFYRVYVDRQTRQTAQQIVVPTIHNDAISSEVSEEEEDDSSSEGSWASDESPF